MSAAVVMSCIGLLKWLYLPTRYTPECAVRESISQSDILTKYLIQLLYQSSLACLPFLWFICFFLLQIIHSDFVLCALVESNHIGASFFLHAIIFQVYHSCTRCAKYTADKQSCQPPRPSWCARRYFGNFQAILIREFFCLY